LKKFGSIRALEVWRNFK